MPVKRDAIGHVVVEGVHLDELSDFRGDRGTGGPPIEGVAVDGVARREVIFPRFAVSSTTTSATRRDLDEIVTLVVRAP